MPYRTKNPFGLEALVCFNKSQITHFVSSEDNVFRHAFAWSFAFSEFTKGSHVFGLTVMGASQLVAALTFADMIKKRNKHNVVVLGGQFITLHLKEIIANKPVFMNVDYVILFDGEGPFLRLVKSLQNRTENRLPGIVYLREAPPYYEHDTGPGVPMEKLPVTDYGLWEDNDRISSVLYETARGCAWGRCKFCYHLNYYGKNLRQKPTNNVIADLEVLIRNSPNREFFLWMQPFTPSNSGFCLKLS